MRKAKVFWVLTVMAFLLTPQLGFSQTGDEIVKLNKINKNLHQINRELLQIQKHYLDLCTSSRHKKDYVMAGEYELQNIHIAAVYDHVDAIRTEIRCTLIYLGAAQYIKNEYKEIWDNFTKQSIQHESIVTINSRLEYMANERPRITNAAALDSINRANNIINELLTILREAEK